MVEYLDNTLFDRATGAFWGCQDYVRENGQIRAGSSPTMLSVIDELIYCDANAKAASAYLDAWWVLGLESCKTKAVSALEFLLGNLKAPGGGRCH